MTPRAWAVIGAIVLAALAGYGAGRYVQPAEVVTRVETKIETKVEVEEKVVEKRVEGPVKVVTRVVTIQVPCPPGGGTVPATETTTTEERGVVVIDRVEDSHGTAETNQVATSTVTVTQEQPRWLLQAGVEAGTGTGWTTSWNVGASRRLAGPFWLGAGWSSEKRVELRAGLTF